jgi:hypothetical protein
LSHERPNGAMSIFRRVTEFLIQIIATRAVHPSDDTAIRNDVLKLKAQVEAIQQELHGTIQELRDRVTERRRPQATGAAIWTFYLTLAAAVGATIVALWTWQAHRARLTAILAFDTESPIRYVERHLDTLVYAYPDSVLNIYNVGETAVQRPRYEVMSMAVFAYRDTSIADSVERDTAYHRLPVEYWFARHKHRFHPKGKDTIATLGVVSPDRSIRIWTNTTAQPIYPPSRLASIVHLVRALYRDAAGAPRDDYYLVSYWDYAKIAKRDGIVIWHEMEEKRRKGQKAVLSDDVPNMRFDPKTDTLDVDTLAAVALNASDHPLSIASLPPGASPADSARWLGARAGLPDFLTDGDYKTAPLWLPTVALTIAIYGVSVLIVRYRKGVWSILAWTVFALTWPVALTVRRHPLRAWMRLDPSERETRRTNDA